MSHACDMHVTGMWHACHLCHMLALYVRVCTYVLQELENDLASVQEKYAVEWSFTMREHERNMAELITYDDMECVTKQLEEEYEKNVRVSVRHSLLTCVDYVRML